MQFDYRVIGVGFLRGEVLEEVLALSRSDVLLRNCWNSTTCCSSKGSCVVGIFRARD